MTSPEETMLILQKALDFTGDALSANRAGRLSRRQQKMLSWRELKTGLYALLAWGIMVLVIVLCGPVIDWFEGFDLLGTLPAMIVLATIALIIGALILRYWIRQIPGILRGQVEAAEGRIALTTIPGNAVRCQMRIGDKCFDIERAFYNTLNRLDADRSHYCVYYMSVSHIIVSAAFYG